MSKNKYWLSLEQWKNEKTFQEQAQKEFITSPFAEGLDRREFLKLMGASLALTSLGCLRRPAEKIVPYTQRPEDIVPGKSNYYASSFYDKGEGFGLIVQTREGRPIKTEGNKKHPMNQGGMSVRAHSHLLALYDPERLKTPQRNLFNKEKTNKERIRADFDELDPAVVSQLKKGKTALLTDHFPSPDSHEVMDMFMKTFQGEPFVWDSSGLESLALSCQKCFGKKLIPRYLLDQAQMIVSINCDFLGTFLSPTEQTKNFSLSRKPTKQMSRLVVFESLMSLTGSNADDRFRIRPSENIHTVLVLIDEVLKLKSPHSIFRKRFQELRKSLPSLACESDVRKTAQELLKHQGKSIVFAGGFSAQTPQEESFLILTHYLNELLGNHHSTIDFQNHYTAWSQKTSGIEEMIKKLNQGKIKNVIIHRANPFYSYPDKAQLIQAIRKAQLVIYTGSHYDETAQYSDYIIPDFHDLEKWCVWEFQKGLYSIQQPTVRPLIQSRAFEDNLIAWMRYDQKNTPAQSWYKHLKWSAKRKNLSWEILLSQGFQQVQNKALPVSFNAQVLRSIKVSPVSLDMELILYTTQGLKDGSLANVSWLQEFPDPVTKICWGNYLCLSPKTARDRGLKEGSIVELKVLQKTLKIPVHIQPGQSGGTVGLALGYGRTHAGQIADKVGVNGFIFMKIFQNNVVSSGLKASLTPSQDNKTLAVVQGHHSMEGRQIVVETTLKQYLKNPKSGIHKHKIFSLWSEHKYPREKWAMVIDLNSCTGCGACIVACQSENNIPVVGEKQVLKGREMHWMRVDRYYSGSPENPQSVVHQPVVCMHCDNAPCETVCPVSATVHSDEGTNDMIYNRCVGTRYCSNNCPYKVRRFNWFNYTKNIETPLNGALNPEVTVRSRGVMEKCTFCIHRVKSKQAEARLKGRTLKDGDIQTACQQSCPAQAIVFGDFNDKNSKVRKAFEKENAYSLLEELNTKPSVRYQTKIKNSENFVKDQKGHHS